MERPHPLRLNHLGCISFGALTTAVKMQKRLSFVSGCDLLAHDKTNKGSKMR